jgi:hypothetical protein
LAVGKFIGALEAKAFVLGVLKLFYKFPNFTHKQSKERKQPLAMYRFIALTLVVLEVIAASPAGKSSCNCGKSQTNRSEFNQQHTPPEINLINHRIRPHKNAEREIRKKLSKVKVFRFLGLQTRPRKKKSEQFSNVLQLCNVIKRVNIVNGDVCD